MTLSVQTDPGNKNRVQVTEQDENFAASLSFEKHYLDYVINRLQEVQKES
jgi:hypothetical protein